MGDQDIEKLVEDDPVLQQVLGVPSGSFQFGFKVSIFNHEMRSRRTARGLTQKQLGNLAGLSGHHIGQVETMRLFPSQESAQCIAQVLCTSVDILFPQWLRFYLQDTSTRVFVRTLDEVAHAMAATSYGLPSGLLNNLLPDPDRVVDNRDAHDALEKAFHVLTPREVEVLNLLFVRDLTLDQAGQELGMSRGRVGQIQDEALRKLRKSDSTQNLRPYRS